MPKSHGDQKQAAKRKKKRELAKRSTKLSSSVWRGAEAEILRRAVLLPHGKTFISAGWDSGPEGPPHVELVTVVVTRVMPGGMVLPGVALVDRTCLGVKSGFLGKPMPEREVQRFLEALAAAHGGIEECELLLGQSIVFHAIDYARALGFEPDRDFPAALFGPRPEKLLDTPWSRPALPMYYAGPNDDVARIRGQLDKAVGAGGYEFMGRVGVGASGFAELLASEGEDEIDGDE